MTETIGARLRQALASAGLNQSDLVRRTGLDKNAVSAIVNDRSHPRPSTVLRIEAALGLTPGTLAGLGEEASGAEGEWAPTAAALSDEELVAELGYRLTRLKRENIDLIARLGRDEAQPVTEQASLGLAAHRAKSDGKLSYDQSQRLGEESQDDGDMDPA